MFMLLLCISVNGFSSVVQEVLVIRKIHPCLPSFKAEFTASVPLTRIRDIAHRNDIPHDLKVILCCACMDFLCNNMIC